MNNTLLRRPVGRGEALAAAVLIHRRAAHHRKDGVTVPLGIREALEHEHPDALRPDGAVGRRSLEMVMAIYQSQLQGNTPVYFPVSLGASGVAALRQAGQFAEKER